MDTRWCLVATLCAASACVPAAFAQSPASVKERQALVKQVTEFEQGGRCNDALFSYFPGRLDYCLGLHDLKRGHYSSGLKFLHLAAGWGNKYAQYSLGLVYFAGHRVPANRPLGLAWLMLANQRHNDGKTERVTRSVKRLATPAQRKRAQTLYTQMLSQYGDKVAAQRAWERFQHASQRSQSLNSGALAGVTRASCTFVIILGNPDAPLQSGMPEATSNVADIFNVVHRSTPKPHQSPAAGTCVSPRVMHQAVRRVAGNYFNGWNGVVTVSPLKQVDAPTASKNK